MATRPPISRFKGLNNVSDPLRLGLGWLQRADDVLVTDSEAMVRRQGYAPVVTGVMRGAFSTLDFTRFYIVSGTTLQRVNADMSLRTLRTGLAPRDMHWVEINRTVFFTNGVDSGIIDQDDQVIDWDWQLPTPPTLSAGTGSLPAGRYQVACTYVLADGRETGSSGSVAIDLPADSSLQISNIPQVAGLQTQTYIAPADSTVFGLALTGAATAATWNSSPDYLGTELTSLLDNPLPRDAIYPTLWQGRVMLAQYMPDVGQTAVWMSQPLGFHLFDYAGGFFLLPGRVALMAATPKGVVIGTESKLYAYDDTGLTTLAEYGAVPGCSWALDDDSSILFWSKRGVCRAMPFENLTEGQVSVATGVSAGAAIVRRNGQKHFVVALRKGDAAFNHRG